MGRMSQEQINTDLFNEVIRLKGEISNFKEGVREVQRYIEECTGTVDKPRTMSMDETIELFNKLAVLLNS